MFAKVAILIAAVAGAHAGVLGGYGAIAAPAYGAAIAAPAYGLGLGYGAPVAKIASAPIVSSYSTVTKHIAAAPIAKTVVAAPAYGAIAAPAYGLGYGAQIAAAPVVSSYGNIW